MTGIAVRGDTGRRSVAQEGTAARRASLDLARRTFAHPGNDAYPSTSTNDGAPPRLGGGNGPVGQRGVNRCGFRSHYSGSGKSLARQRVAVPPEVRCHRLASASRQ